MAEDRIVLTPEGYDRIKQELHHLSAVERPEVRRRLGEAKQSAEDFDTSEYETAKMDQALVESRISELEDVIRRARVLEPDEIPTKEVGLGSVVKLKDLETGDTWEVRVVSSFESDPNEDRISIESPLGQAMLGKKQRSEVEVQAPGGVIKHRIMKISR
ncbi:MAG: transcription elongation factor GreA [Armatimonadia bacterium]|jgi:transcription elongation factor GreA|nr:transcription elongation factor GreA [Armatimonadia bacterium]